MPVFDFNNAPAKIRSRSALMKYSIPTKGPLPRIIRCWSLEIKRRDFPITPAEYLPIRSGDRFEWKEDGETCSVDIVKIDARFVSL